jgi:hypothetical protein
MYNPQRTAKIRHRRALMPMALRRDLEFSTQDTFVSWEWDAERWAGD